MKKLFKKCTALFLVGVILSLSACDRSPVRNPFAGRPEPKMGELPQLPNEAVPPLGKVSWSSNILAKQDRFSKLRPLIRDNFVFAADHSGKVVALDRHHGKKVWTSNTGKKYIAGPSLVDNKIILTTSDAKVVALDRFSGHLLWETKISTEALAPPSGRNGVVIVHVSDGSVCALNSENGSELWNVAQSTPSLTLRFSSTPVVVGNTALVGFSTGKLLAFNLQSGLIEWERVISLPRGRSELQRMVDISADPIVIDNTAYVITYQGKLAAINILNGDLEWERDVSSYQNMAHDYHQLYITDNNNCLWAIDRESGNIMWKQAALAERFITGPAVVNNLVVVGDRGGYVHFIAAENGHLLNRLHVANKLYHSPLSMGSDLLVSSHNGKIAAVHCG